MRKLLLYVLAVLCAGRVATAADKPPMTAQVQRGRELFQHSKKGTPCGTCHLVNGVGTAVGPDLTRIATVVGPRALAITIQMTMTAYVQQVKTATSTFPGIQKSKQGDKIEVWDLGQMPPVLRTLSSNEVLSMQANEKWKHPPTSAGYTSQELADIIAFLKWAAVGSQAEVKESDLR